MENKEPTPIELLKMFAEGAKIHYRPWEDDPSKYIVFYDGKCVDQDGYAFNPTIEKILAGEYELYREPKKLKRYWLWDIEPTNGHWFRNGNFLDEKGFTTNGGQTGLNWNHIEKRKAEPEQFIDVEVSE